MVTIKKELKGRVKTKVCYAFNCIVFTDRGPKTFVNIF